MKLVTFIEEQAVRAGLVLADQTVLPVDELLPDVPSEVLGIVEAGEPLWSRLADVSRRASGGTPLSSVRLLAPIPRPRRSVFCVGWNYSEHFAEGQGLRGGNEPRAIPEWPAFFSKNPRTVVGPDAPVWDPAPHSEQLDWEVELAVVIGRRGTNIAEGGALAHVFGYTIGNDVSVRDVQRRHGQQWFKGKNFDSHLPLGPWIVTADELGDPHDLRITSRVNGVVKQDSRTRYMVFKIPRLLRDLSAGMELEPGDIVLTGTPSGVGFARTPPEFLRVGDVMEMEIEKIGMLRNRVQARMR